MLIEDFLKNHLKKQWNSGRLATLLVPTYMLAAGEMMREMENHHFDKQELYGLVSTLNQHTDHFIFRFIFDAYSKFKYPDLMD